MEKIKQNEKDKRQDIYTLASVYLGQLRQRKPQMLEESKFHLKEVDKVPKSSPISFNFDKPVQNNVSSSIQEEKQQKQAQKPQITTITPSNATNGSNQKIPNQQDTGNKAANSNSQSNNNIISTNNKSQSNTQTTQSGAQIKSNQSSAEGNKLHHKQNESKTIS